VTPRAFLRDAAREARGQGGRMVFFVVCLAVGVAAVTAVAGLGAGLAGALAGDARKLLAADVSVEGRRPIPAELDAILASVPGAARANVEMTATVVSGKDANGGDGRSLLVQLKAVPAEYPFFGAVDLGATGGARTLPELLRDDGTVVAPEILARLGLALGDSLRIGERDFRVTGTVLSEPDRIDIGFTLGPRVFVAQGAIERAGLAGFGSRVTHRALVRLGASATAEDATRLAERIRAEMPGAVYYEVRTLRDPQPGLRNALRRAERFLGLVALVSLLVGGVGVGQTVRAWLACRLDAIAIRKVLGMRAREILLLYLGQTLLLGLAGSVLGALAGLGLLAAAPALSGGLLRSSVVGFWQPYAVARGIVLGIGVAILFALPALLRVRRVPPLRVFRRDLEPIRGSRSARASIALVLFGGVLGAAASQSRSLWLGSGFTAALAVATGALALAAWLLARGVGRTAYRLSAVSARYGLAGVARPGADTLGSMTALGLGTLVVLGMYLVQRDLDRSLRAELPAEAPSTFFVDIQPDQWDSFRGELTDAGAVALRSSPIVNARIVTVDGRSVRELTEAPGERRGRGWALTREQNLTYTAELPSDNRLLEGQWWQAPGGDEVSVEREFARDLGAKLGSKLELDVQGVALSATVTSLREVTWGSFRPNFFLIFEPGLLEAAPQVRVAAARLPAGREQAIQDRLAARFPNVVAIPIREVLERLAGVLAKAGQGVRFLGGFTVLAGIAILAGAVTANSARRRRETALLKTLGMTRAGVVAVLAIEYGLVGLVAGFVGAIGGGVLSFAVVTYGMELDWTFALGPCAVAVAAVALVTAAAGIGASWPALTRPPLQELGG